MSRLTVARLIWAVTLLAMLALLLFVTARPSEAATVATTVNVVAHEDDDLLFQNPDIQADIKAGKRVMTVYVTAGDAGLGTAYYQGREAGERAAYARMAGRANSWAVGYVYVDGHRMARSCMNGTHLCLLFMRLPGGNTVEKRLPMLLNGQINKVTTVDGGSTYTASQVEHTLLTVFNIMTPNYIRALNWNSDMQGDHLDHKASAIFAYRAHTHYTRPHRIDAYQGYSVRPRPSNLTVDQQKDKAATFLTYAPHDSHVCKSLAQCYRGTYGHYFQRRYVVASATK